MKRTTRLRFTAGILAVLAICCGLFVYLEYSMSRLPSVDAYLDSDSFTVGIDYSSIVEKQFVEEGAYVKKGDPLFEVRSSSLSEAIRNNQITQSTLLYSVTPEGSVSIDAAADGRVRTVKYHVGAFVPANTEMAVINAKDGLFINATYKLSSPDYARLSLGSKVVVTMPDNVKIDGSVYDVSLKEKDDEVFTTVKVKIDQSKVNQVAFTVGTPVETVLHLNDDTLASRLKRFVTNILQPSGK